MAFGFPAKYSLSVHLESLTGEDIKSLLVKEINYIGWRINEASQYQIRVSTNLNWYSWGEKIVLDIQSGGIVYIESKCALITQCFDWGRNKENVGKLIQAIEKNVTSIEIRGHPQNKG